ncbi:MAG: thermonuclease family protein [Bacteroidota bacterium]
MRDTRIILICLVIVHFWAIVAHAQQLTVTMVIDGDKLVLSDGSKVRLAGIDAPEVHPSEKLTRDALASGKSADRVMHQGRQAAAHLSAMAGGQIVRVVWVAQMGFEAYKPAMVYVTGEQGKIRYGLNQKMVEEGFAVAEADGKLLSTQGYPALEAKARSEKRGLWVTSNIFIAPRAVKTEKADPFTMSGKCMRDAACVWVSVGEIDQSLGMWKSKPGKRCACALQ